jgi:hypothetical protein
MDESDAKFVGQGNSQIALHARSLGPLVKARAFGMTPHKGV